MFLWAKLIGTQLVKGLGVGEQSVIGKAVVATSAEEANSKVQDGDILVAKTTDKDYLPAIKKASGMVVEASGLTSHAAVVGLSLGIPVIVGVLRLLLMLVVVLFTKAKQLTFNLN